jgi:hypothetical protein
MAEETADNLNVDELGEMAQIAAQRDPNVTMGAQAAEGGAPMPEANPALAGQNLPELDRPASTEGLFPEEIPETGEMFDWNAGNARPRGGEPTDLNQVRGERAQQKKETMNEIRMRATEELQDMQTAARLKDVTPEYNVGDRFVSPGPATVGGNRMQGEVGLPDGSKGEVRLTAENLKHVEKKTGPKAGLTRAGKGERGAVGDPQAVEKRVIQQAEAEFKRRSGGFNSGVGVRNNPETGRLEFEDDLMNEQIREFGINQGYDPDAYLHSTALFESKIDTMKANRSGGNFAGRWGKQRGAVENTGAGQQVLATQAGRNALTNTAELGREANALNAGLNRARGTQSLNRAEYIYGDTPAAKPNSRRIVDVGIELQEEALDAWGGKPMEMTPENAKTVAANMTEEAARSFERRPEMSGWYKANLDEAMQHASKIHPELATDPKSQSAFKFIMAITSNGQEVPLNGKLTNQYYQQWKRDGKFPIAGSGKERAAMEKSFETANRLVDDMGYEGFDNFLDSDFTVRELQEAGFKVSGENLDTTVKGSVIFGPKIGGGFMQNLRGNYDPPTFDRWWQRTYGRHTGTLISDPKKIGDQIEAFSDALDDVEPEAFKVMGMTKKQAMDNPEEAARVIYSNFSKGGFKVKSEVNNAARNLVKSLDNVVDSPAGGVQREFMRDVILQVRDNLRERGIDVDTADVQALLWYSEKDLYGKMGAFTNTDTVDYATVWKQLAEQGQEGSNALNRSAP